MKKKQIASATAALMLAMGMASTGHAWGFLSGNTTNVTPQSAGGNINSNNVTNSPSSTNSTNTQFLEGATQNPSTGSTTSASAVGGGGGWNWGGWNWGGSGANASASANNTFGSGMGSYNNGVQGNGGNTTTMGGNLGDTISTGNTYTGNAAITAAANIQTASINSATQLGLAKLGK